MLTIRKKLLIYKDTHTTLVVYPISLGEVLQMNTRHLHSFLKLNKKYIHLVNKGVN